MRSDESHGSGSRARAVVAGGKAKPEKRYDMMPKKVFLSYASEDRGAARRLCDSLSSDFFHIWLDERSLLPGQNWPTEISEAIRTSDYFIALLSHRSVSKRGVVQKELRDAINVMSELPPGRIFLIPVRLDDCEPTHPVLAELHWIDLFRDWESGVMKILVSMIQDFFRRGRWYSPVNLMDVLANCINMLCGEPGDSRVTLHLDRKVSATIMGDEAMLRQAFANILLNAVQHSDTAVTGGRPTVSITSYLVSGRVYVKIENVGDLIPAETIYSGLLFRPGYTTKKAGTGLGLAVTLSIVHEHGGVLFVESTPIPARRGHPKLARTSFTVSLPTFEVGT